MARTQKPSTVIVQADCMKSQCVLRSRGMLNLSAL